MYPLAVPAKACLVGMVQAGAASRNLHRKRSHCDPSGVDCNCRTPESGCPVPVSFASRPSCREGHNCRRDRSAEGSGHLRVLQAPAAEAISARKPDGEAGGPAP